MNSLVTFCSFVFKREARRSTPRGASSRVPRGGAHRGARREFRVEEHTEERVTILARHDLRAQRGGEHRGARREFRY